MKLEQLENKVGQHNEEIDELFEAIRNLANAATEPRKVIGYKWEK